MSKTPSERVHLTAGGSARLVDFWEKHPPRPDLQSSNGGSGVIEESGSVDAATFAQRPAPEGFSCQEPSPGHGHGSQPEFPEERATAPDDVGAELLLDLEDLLRQGLYRGDALSKIARDVLAFFSVYVASGDALYIDRTDDLIACQEICRALYALCGESPEAQRLAEAAEALLR